jgi:alpha-L-fucosidase
VVIEGFREDEVRWTAEDFRFTSKNGIVYAFLMKWPEGGRCSVTNLAMDRGIPVKSVELLGHGPVRFEQDSRALSVVLPGKSPVPFTACLRIG